MHPHYSLFRVTAVSKIAQTILPSVYVQIVDPNLVPPNRHFLTGYWKKLVPERHIIQGLRQDVLEWIIARQIKAVEKYGIEG